MIKSMTACGLAKVEGKVGSLSCQIQSINRKHLDVVLQMPDLLFGKESTIRQMTSSKVKRGHLQVRFQFHPHETLELETHLHRALARSFHQELNSVAEELGRKVSDDLFFTLLSHQKGFFGSEMRSSAKEELDHLVDEALEEALAKLDQMKRVEGERILVDMERRLDHIESHFVSIRKEVAGLPAKVQERLKKQLQSLLEAEVSHERFDQEVAFIAQKADVSEELLRFESHLSEYRKALRNSEGEGKKLEFLLQELSREINTLNAKAEGTKVPALAIEIKCELEKIREQVQNVE